MHFVSRTCKKLHGRNGAVGTPRNPRIDLQRLAIRLWGPGAGRRNSGYFRKMIRPASRV